MLTLRKRAETMVNVCNNRNSVLRSITIATFQLVIIQFIPTQTSSSLYTPCPNSCSSNGKCNSPWGTCTCFTGYTGADCSLRTCPTGPAWSDSATSTDSAHHEAECSNRGKCDRSTGRCICQEGMFEGSACERFICPNGCSGRGRCVSSRVLAKMADPGKKRKDVGCTSGDICLDGPCDTRDYGVCMETDEYVLPWEADRWFGCLCDEGYAGYDCSIRTCPEGDDPLTGAQVNDVQLIECHADFGTFTLNYGGDSTTPIPVEATLAELMEALNALPSLHGANPKVAVSWTGGVAQVCIDTGNLIQVTFLQNFGDLPLLIPDGTHLGQTSAANTPLVTVQKVVSGTKESDSCSNHGTCDEKLGLCQCLDDWMTSDGYGNAGKRGDCGFLSSGTTSTCPGEPACLGHGTCSGPPEYRCVCEEGRSGPDCSLIDCPIGNSWFSFPTGPNTAHSNAECSDMGTCNRATGLCECADGFVGSACQYLSCPQNCHGHGECVSMSTLAENNEVNGILSPQTYGIDPNNSLTWDGDQVFGCLCSDGWEGYDCFLKSCPSGDDPNTQHQSNEVQQLSCTDSDDAGSFQLTFRDQAVNVAVTNTAAELEVALNLLSTINRVSVAYNDPNIHVGASALAADALQVCRASGQLIDIEFLSPTGNVPEIVISDSLSEIDGSLTMTTIKDGNKEYIACSGRGLCDHSTGLCDCFPGYGSSDGQGNAGTLNDCGFRSPYVLE